MHDPIDRASRHTTLRPRAPKFLQANLTWTQVLMTASRYRTMTKEGTCLRNEYDDIRRLGRRVKLHHVVEPCEISPRRLAWAALPLIYSLESSRNLDCLDFERKLPYAPLKTRVLRPTCRTRARCEWKIMVCVYTCIEISCCERILFMRQRAYPLVMTMRALNRSLSMKWSMIYAPMFGALRYKSKREW